MSGICNWIVTTNGFTQDLGRDNGQAALWRKLRKYAGGNTCVLTPRTWNDNWANVAAFIATNSDPDVRASGHITIIGNFYSYGGGVAFPKFCKALDDYALGVRHAVLVDPVPRFGPVRPWAKVYVHGNVSNVTHFYQRQSTPRGHDLRLQWPAYTKVVHRDELRRPHVGIDDDPAFHQAFIDIVKEIA